jgi:hypothetical protein
MRAALAAERAVRPLSPLAKLFLIRAAELEPAA